MDHSKRRYQIQTSSRGVFDNFQASITEIENNGEDETMFALQGEFDALLDLRQGEAMYFQPNRDDSSSKGIVTRIA